MGLSEAMLFAFAATIICAFAIAEKIIDIDFEQFMPKNLKKAKMKRIIENIKNIIRFMIETRLLFLFCHRLV